MDSSSLQHHHQEIMESQSLDSMLVSTKAQNQGGQQQQQQEKKPRPAEQALKCPRCESTNTKFCYYNNYSLSQPRYFCKSCRRYWTKGGTLRNVPVGGGCRKNRRSSSSSATSSSSSLSSSRRISTTPDHHNNHLINHPSSSPSPLITPYDHHHHDLTLAFARLQKQVNGSMGLDHHHHHHDESHGNIGSLLGSNAHFDLFGNTFLHDPQNHGLQHLYYGLDVENGVHHDDHHHHHQQQQHQMGMPNEQQNQEMLSNPSSGCSTPTGIKQELGGGVVENRTGGVNLWGLPWQLSSGGGGGDNQGNYINNVGGGGGTNGGGNDHQIDTLRESWNSSVLIGSSWHNSLLNSALM